MATGTLPKTKSLILTTVGALLGGILITAVKFWGWYYTSSQAVYSDFLESIVNIIAGGIAVFVIKYSLKPADRGHPYGHGKIEYFSAAFEGGMIAFAAIVILFEAVSALFVGSDLRNLQEGAGIVLTCGLANFLIGAGVKRVGQRVGSPALVANGTHLQSDFITSAGVTLGLLLAYWTGEKWLDPVVAIIVAGHLAITGLMVIRRSVGGLLDEEDRGILLNLVKALREIDFGGVIQVHHARIVRSGQYHHIDAHAVVPEYWDVAEAHKKTAEFEKRLLEHYPYPGELHLHIDPCRRVYCEQCPDAKCPIRARPFVKRISSELESLVDPNEPKDFR